MEHAQQIKQQNAAQEDSCVFIDPKSDSALLEKIFAQCRVIGRSKDTSDCQQKSAPYYRQFDKRKF